MSKLASYPAPVAVFAFKRPKHLRHTLESLARNPEFDRSPLHIFCDGPRRPEDVASVEAVRILAREWIHPRKTVHEASANRGLAASIIEGVRQLCEKYGRVIVVEDDLTVAPVFLDFMNSALEHYADDASVMQVSGHMFPVKLPNLNSDALLMPFTTSWGWATWQRAWSLFDPDMRAFEQLARNRGLRCRFDLDRSYPYFSMLLKQRAGKIDSWAIRWYLSVFMHRGLVLYPKQSLVNNDGFDGSGTHSDAYTGKTDADVASITGRLVKWPGGEVDEAGFQVVKQLLRSQNTLWQRASRYLRRRFS